MKKNLLAGLIIGMFFVGISSMAHALSLTDVGGFDDYVDSTKLDNSGEATEIDWVNSVLLLEDPVGFVPFTSLIKTPVVWIELDDTAPAGSYAALLSSVPEYFLVKTGNVTDLDVTREWLFRNVASLDYAVINLEEMGFDKIDNITGISHVSQFGEAAAPVPEPATMLLFGTGLVGLIGAARRRNKK